MGTGSSKQKSGSFLKKDSEGLSQSKQSSASLKAPAKSSAQIKPQSEQAAGNMKTEATHTQIGEKISVEESKEQLPFALSEALAAANAHEEEKTNAIRKISVEMNTDFDSRLCNQVDLLLDPNTDMKPSMDKPDGQEARQGDDSKEQTPPSAFKKFMKKKKKMRPQGYEDLEFRQLRSRTETPSKEEPKLPTWPFGRDKAAKQSPGKIIQKQRDRQEKAEMIRAQIVANRQQQMEKIRNRQKENKSRVDEMKNATMIKQSMRLQDKIVNARDKRAEEIRLVKQKAQMDVQAVEDIKLIMRFQQQNLQLDIANKLSETEERRIQYQQDQKKRIDHKQKEEEVQKRRLELSNIRKDVIKKAEIKRQQAMQRKQKIISQKQKASEEQEKRMLVLQRKKGLDQQISDMKSIISDKDNIWDLIGNEEIIKDEKCGVAISKKDLLNLEKNQLVKDATFLNKIIFFDQDDKMHVKMEGDDYLHFCKLLKGKEFLSNSSSEITSENSSERENELFEGKSQTSSQRVRYKFNKGQCLDQGSNSSFRFRESSPINQHHSMIKKGLNTNSEGDEINANNSYESLNGENEDINGHFSDQIINESDSTIQIQQLQQSMLEKKRALNLEERRNSQAVLQSNKQLLNQAEISHQNSVISGQNDQKSQHSKQTQQSGLGLQGQHLKSLYIPQITDEEEQLMLWESRMHWSIKRNVLRDTMSEDLMWAQCIKIENEDFFEKLRYQINQLKVQETRSLQSTPERVRPMDECASNQRERSCDDRIFGSASSRRRFQRSSRIKSRKSSNSSNYQKCLQKSKSKDILVTSGSSNILLESRSLQILNRENQGSNLSKRRRNRDNSKESYDSHRIMGRSSMGNIQPRNLFNNTGNLANVYGTEMTKDDSSLNMTSQSHATNFGSQMNQMITNMKPILPYQSAKILPKLSTNAQKILFPIREQKILFKRPGKEGQFINVRITLKLEDMQQMIQNQSIMQTSAQTVPDIQIETQMDEKPSQDLIQTPSVTGPSLKLGQSAESTPKKSGSLPITPGTGRTKDPLGSKQVMQKTPTQEKAHVDRNKDKYFKECAVKYLLGGQHNDLLKNEDAQKSIELTGEDTCQIIQFLDRLEQSDLQFRYCRLCEAILSETDNCANADEALGGNEEREDKMNLSPSQFESQGGEEYIIDHVQSNKQHRKIREDLGIKDLEDLCFSILHFGSSPGDITKELIKEKEKALKRKVKRLKVQLQQMAVSHENVGCQQAWKDYSSANKKSLQIRCLELEKQVNPVIRDYDSLEANLKEIKKILEVKNQGDLMLFRKLKFIPTLSDICKRILICPKQEFKHLGKVIELSIKILTIICTLRENRNYMLQTNRIMPLVDLLYWCLSRPTQIFFGISFLPQLFQIITLHIKHRTPYECLQSKEIFMEILICSQVMTKIKKQYAVINYPMAMDMSQMMGQVPMFLLKSITFIEAITAITSSDSRYRPIYERNNKMGEHYLFVIQNTEIFGIINMISTLLLTHSEQFKASQNPMEGLNEQAIRSLPQTFLSLSIVCIKVLNNVIRMDVNFIQQLISNSEGMTDQLYHLISYLLVYTNQNYDKNEDTKELLHETLLFIGYFCLLNEEGQELLQRGENTIMQKLCNLPFPYFSDKKLKEILFPTLIQTSYKSERCVAIMNQEISFDPLIKFLNDNMKEELPRIMEEEFDYQSISSLGDGGRGHGMRSPSMGSTNSSGCSIQMESISNGNCPYLPLVMRFPKSKWQDAIDFYKSLE